AQRAEGERRPSGGFAQRAEGERRPSGGFAQRAEGERRPSGGFAQRAEGERSPEGERVSDRDPADRAAAGGVPAIASTVARVVRGPGLRRGAELLAQVNQVRGFDCPSCAWPVPR